MNVQYVSDIEADLYSVERILSLFLAGENDEVSITMSLLILGPIGITSC